jgi:hypothetical protein
MRVPLCKCDGIDDNIGASAPKLASGFLKPIAFTGDRSGAPGRALKRRYVVAVCREVIADVTAGVTSPTENEHPHEARVAPSFPGT